MYTKIHGTTVMGLPVSVVVGSLVMEDVDWKALSTFHPPQFWMRYVNDTCSGIPSDLVDSFHSHLNNIDLNI